MNAVRNGRHPIWKQEKGDQCREKAPSILFAKHAVASSVLTPPASSPTPSISARRWTLGPLQEADGVVLQLPRLLASLAVLASLASALASLWRLTDVAAERWQAKAVLTSAPTRRYG